MCCASSLQFFNIPPSENSKTKVFLCSKTTNFPKKKPENENLNFFSIFSILITLYKEESLNELITKNSNDKPIYGVFTWNNFYLQVQSPELAQIILKNEKIFEKTISSFEGKHYYNFLGPNRIVNVKHDIWKK